MSEEKPNFKITDRRLFNPDGSSREVERAAETPEPTATPDDTAAATVEQSSAAPAAVDDARATTPARGDEASAREESALRAEEEFSLPPPPREAREARDAPAATTTGGAAAAGDDPAHFANLVMALAQPAAMSLGMIDHPSLAGEEIDLPLAKQYIDLLTTLRRKTLGNLSAEEENVIEGLLTELRMQYVSLANARPGVKAPGAPRGPRGFTGGDITGGR